MAYWLTLKYSSICPKCGVRMLPKEKAIMHEGKPHHGKCVPEINLKPEDKRQLTLFPITKTTRACLYELGGFGGSWKRDPRYVYIGRGSLYGNPATHMHGPSMAVVQVNTLQEAISYHKKWLRGAVRLPNIPVPSHKEMMDNLKGKILVCYCSTGNPCHADTYIEIVENPRVWWCVVCHDYPVDPEQGFDTCMNCTRRV